MAAVMLAGAPLCNEAFAASELVSYAEPTTKKDLANGLKFVVSFVDGTTTKYLQVSKVDETNFVTRSGNHQTDISNASVFEIRNYNGGAFELWVDGKQFVVKKDGTTYAKSDDKNIAKTFVAKKTSGSTATVAKTTDFNKIYTYVVGDTGENLWGATLVPGSIKETLDADALKEINSSSTSFSFGADAVEGNIFQELTPRKYTFTPAGETASVNGTIFVKGAEKDIKAWEDAATAKKKEAAAKLSIAYVKNETWGLNTSATGEGYKLVMINGAEFYAEKDAAKWDNAVFTGIAESDQLNAKDEIELTIKPIIAKETRGTKVNIAAVKASASDTKTYVTTVVSTGTKYAKVIKPTLGDNTYFAASEFLSAGKSVYNVYFTSGKESVKDGITTEHHKYMAVTSNGSAFQADALAANDVQLNSPFAQWVATGFDGKYTLTLTNRQTMQNVVLKLNATTTAGVYKIVSVAGSTYDKLASLDDKDSANSDDEKKLAGKEIKLVKTSVTKTDGYLDLTNEEMAAKVAFKFSGKSNELGKTSFYAVPNYVATGTNADSYDKLYPSQDEKKIEFYDIKKTDVEVLNVTNYAYLNADNQIVTDAADTLQVPVYNISYSYFKEDAKKATVAYVKNRTLELNEATTALPSPVKENFIFPMAMNGSYTMAIASTNSAPSEYNADRWATGVVKSTTINFAADGTIKAFDPKDGDFAYVTVLLNDNNDRTSLEAASRHATFENSLGSVSMQVNKNGIIEGILAAEPATFWLDTLTNGDEVSFYISKGIKAAAETKADEAAEVRNFMYYAKDSLYIFDEGSALASQNKNYLLEGTDADVKAIFRPATLVAHDTLTTVVDGKEKSLVKDALKAFQYGIVLADEEVAGEYVIYSKANPSKYLYSRNGKLGFGSEKEALVVKLGEGDATANEAIAAENVAVIAGEGVVTVKGAAGKQVVVSNILGQVIANKVATSDEETIAVAAGVAVVVVDGEATKVVVK